MTPTSGSDEAENLDRAQSMLGMFLDAIRAEAVDADWDVRCEQIADLHHRLVEAMEGWMRENGRLP